MVVRVDEIDGFFEHFDSANEQGQPDESTSEAPAEERRVWTPAERVAQWRTDGPLVHEPTGIAKLDELTGGGPVYGSRWYLLGAPDAWKTALVVQLADEWQRRGIAVGSLAVDEEADDLTTRLAQRAKFSRQECEVRSEETLRELEAAFAPSETNPHPPIRMYGPEWTIESAAEDLALCAKRFGNARSALFVDSIQQVACSAMLGAEREMSERQIVTANVRALRKVATAYRMITIATSEMNRGAYRNVEAAEASNDMAAGKESGSIEFSARVMLSLRSVKDHGDLIQLRVVKNKHGPSYPSVADLFLAADRSRQSLTMADQPETATEQPKTKARKAEHVSAAAALAVYLATHQGDGSRDVRSGLRLALGTCPKDLADDAANLLHDVGAVTWPDDIGPGKPKPHYLDGAKVPADVMSEVPLERRADVASARPPPPEAP